MYITTSIKYIHMCIHITFSILIKPLWRRCLKTFLNKLYENWTFSSHFGSLQHFCKLSNKRCRGLYPTDSMWNILYITAMLRKLEYVTPFSRSSDGLSIKIKRKSKLLSWPQNAYDRVPGCLSDLPSPHPTWSLSFPQLCLPCICLDTPSMLLLGALPWVCPSDLLIYSGLRSNITSSGRLSLNLIILHPLATLYTSSWRCSVC